MWCYCADTLRALGVDLLVNFSGHQLFYGLSPQGTLGALIPFGGYSLTPFFILELAALLYDLGLCLREDHELVLVS